MMLKEVLDAPRATRRPREGWEDRFRAMHERDDDRPIEEFLNSTWDEQEWER
jgi:hypothetical protein